MFKPRSKNTQQFKMTDTNDEQKIDNNDKSASTLFEPRIKMKGQATIDQKPAQNIFVLDFPEPINEEFTPIILNINDHPDESFFDKINNNSAINADEFINLHNQQNSSNNRSNIYNSTTSKINTQKKQQPEIIFEDIPFPQSSSYEISLIKINSQIDDEMNRNTELLKKFTQDTKIVFL